VTQYQSVYQSFIEWYNLFFGVDGLVDVSQREVMDGSVPVYEFSGNITSFEGGEGAATFAVDRPFGIQEQLENIAEWISTKFGTVILQNSCNLCNSQNTPVVVPPTNNGTNSTDGGNSSNSTNGTTGGNGTDNGTAVDNSTTPVDNTTTPVDNSTPVENSTLPVENGTVPVGPEVPVQE